MRKLCSVQLNGVTVQDALDEFSARAEDEFGIAEDDIVSVSVSPTPPDSPKPKISMVDGVKEARYTVVVVYWERA